MFLCSFSLAINFIQVLGSTDNLAGTYESLFEAGKEAYLQERWYECADHMSKALEDFRLFQNNLIACRQKCHKEITPNDSTQKHLDLTFFTSVVKKSDCLRRCKDEKIGNRPETVKEEIHEIFLNLEPYDYLQICGYKVNQWCDPS